MSEKQEKETDVWIRRLKAISDSGTSTLGFLALLYILWTSTQDQSQNMQAQTEALKLIAETYAGK